METLTEYQFKTVKRLANSRVKVYCCPTGLPSDKNENAINMDFNQILGLVEMGLAVDASDYPKFREIVQQNTDEGRECVVIVISVRGQRMFERVRWEKWVN